MQLGVPVYIEADWTLRKSKEGLRVIFLSLSRLHNDGGRMRERPGTHGCCLSVCQFNHMSGIMILMPRGLISNSCGWLLFMIFYYMFICYLQHICYRRNVSQHWPLSLSIMCTVELVGSDVHYRKLTSYYNHVHKDNNEDDYHNLINGNSDAN